MKYTFIILLSFWSFTLIAQQDSLQLDEVIEAAIQNNYNIKIAKNNLEAATNNATIGMAGFLPTADVGASYSYSNSITNTKFNGGIPDQSEPAAAAQQYGANVNLRYTIFDGLKPVYKLKKSKVDVQLGNTQYKQAIENTVYSIIQAYYNLAILEEDFRIAKEKLTLTKVQLKRIENKRKYGQGSEIERLNLLTTFNSDSTQILRLALSKRQAIRQLNKAIGAEEVQETAPISVNTDLDLGINYDNVWEAATQNNLTLLKSEQNIQKSKLDYKIIESELYPKLNTTITYGYSGSQNDAGIMKSNSNLGPSINLGLSYTIFSGGQLKPNRQNSKINIKNAELNLEMAKYDLEQNIKDAWTNHENNIALIPIEQSNVLISQESFERTTTAYQLGQTTYLEYQQAQFNYLQAKKRVITARYNAKMSEWELRRLSSQLVE